MAEGKQKRVVPVKDGIYKIPADGQQGYLIGTRCKQCGSTFYPGRNNCVVCYSEEIEKVPLSKRGKLFRYTVIHQNYPGSALTPPYIAAQVKMPEQVYVTTELTGIDVKDVKIDMAVECYFYTLKEDDEKKVVAFGFRPV